MTTILSNTFRHSPVPQLLRYAVCLVSSHHIADNFDTYYVNKIGLPYSETVGVGSNARQVTCNTREELLTFLRSEDSLCAYSNYQELLAICNMLNIKIHVFTYGIGGVESSWSWRTVFPDPDMAKLSDFAPGTVPDMYLYNSDNCHYDLLVEDNSRLAVLGLVTLGEGKEVEEKEAAMKKMDENEVNKIEPGNKEKDQVNNEVNKEVGVDNVTDKSSEEPWKTVKTKIKNTTIPVSGEQTKATVDSEEEVLTKQKKSGHKRDGPQTVSKVQNKQNPVINLEGHMDNLKVSPNYCEKCQEEFVKVADLNIHMKTKHSKQWNCNQCDFQASTREVLMNHCKRTQGHQPAKQSLGQTGVMECYTCRKEFRSYHNLMEHRKEEHPSHKKCRYYLKGECKFGGEECWYVHEDKVNKNGRPDESESIIQCYICKNEFHSKHDLISHKKKHHLHFSDINQGRSPTQNAWSKPLPSVQNQDFHQLPHPAAPDQGALLEAINKLNQRLQAMESHIFPNQK